MFDAMQRETAVLHNVVAAINRHPFHLRPAQWQRIVALPLVNVAGAANNVPKRLVAMFLIHQHKVIIFRPLPQRAHLH